LRSNYKRIGDCIKQIKVKNTEGKYDLLLGININKYFMPSVANIVGTDLTRYKVVKKNQFACNRMHVGRDYRIPMALSDNESPFIVSPAYTVFEIIDESNLLPEYLMMWFSRAEFDRETWFHTDADVRGGLPWDLFCDIELPIPSIEKQQKIVNECNTITNRIALNEQLNQKLEETAQALYKHWFVNFEFPNEEGEPYKSSGGEMIFNEELDIEIPEGWEVGIIGDLFTFQRGHDLPSQRRIKGAYPIFASSGIAGFHNEFKINKPTIITGRSGSLGELFYYDKPCWPLNTSLYIKDFKESTPFYSLYFLKTINLKELGAGSAVPTLNRNVIHALSKEIPCTRVLELFENKVTSIKMFKDLNTNVIDKMEGFKGLLLAKMTKVEVEKEIA
jgi:type I restriction enzyme S subunit